MHMSQRAQKTMAQAVTIATTLVVKTWVILAAQVRKQIFVEVLYFCLFMEPYVLNLASSGCKTEPTAKGATR